MTEIVAAHLERVAKELAAAINNLDDMWLSDTFPTESVSKLLAAALVACAREEAKWWARYHGKDYNGEGTARLAALERTAGEKASLDPQGGQHES